MDDACSISIRSLDMKGLECSVLRAAPLGTVRGRLDVCTLTDSWSMSNREEQCVGEGPMMCEPENFNTSRGVT